MTATTAIATACAWCRRAFPCPPSSNGETQIYCSRLHQDWAQAVSAGRYPVAHCPRCGRHDLRVAGPDWAICQTFGYQTDRPDLEPGPITPRNMFSNNSDIKERLARAGDVA